MNFPLLSLPEKVWKPLLQKMTYKPLCRLRKSHKALDTFVEHNRFEIKAVVDAEPYTSETYEDIEFEITFCIATQNFYFMLTKYLGGYDVVSFNLNTKSLSAIYIHRATLNICENEDEALIEDPLEENTISLEDVKRLRFSCTWLYLSAGRTSCEIDLLETILSCFQFSKLRMFNRADSHFLYSPVLQNCLDVEISGGLDNAEELLKILPHVRMRKFKIHSIIVKFPEFVLALSEALKRDVNAKGSLEFLSLTPIIDCNFDILSPFLIWKGYIGRSFYRNEKGETVWDWKQKCYIYLTEVKKGAVLIIHYERDLRLLFIEENVRENIMLEIVKFVMTWVPCDISTRWEELMTTSDLTGAIEGMMRGFQADYFFRSLY